MEIKFLDKTVSRDFRKALAAELPGLADNQAYWRMTQYLMFAGWRDIDSDDLLLPYQLVAAIEGKRPTSNYSAIKFIVRYQRDVGVDMKLVWQQLHFDPLKSKARRVKSVKFPLAVEALAKAERRSRSEDRVWMHNGATWLRRHAAKQRKDARLDAERRAASCTLLCPQSYHLASFLNSMPPNRFTSSLRHLEEARAAASKYSDAKVQLNILMAIEDQAQPFYVCVDKTTRIYSLQESVLRLRRELRQIMTQDWITADLRSAQLAIVARLWDIPSVQDYLSEGRSIWRDLCQHMNLEFDDEAKAIVKGALYAITFGAGKVRMHEYFGRFYKNPLAAFTHYKTHEVVRTLLLSRSRQLRAIRKAGSGVDAFGRELNLQYRDLPNSPYRFDNSRSILACIAQSYEMKLLMPVAELAMAQQFLDHGFTITTWLHDGFTFDVHNERDKDTWKTKLATLVRDQAEVLGIKTELEFEG